MAEQHTLRVIARIHSDFPTKFGIPRQSGLKEHYGVMPFDCKQYERLYEFMKHDKKNSAGIINFTLLTEIGDIQINQSASKDEIFEMLDFYRESMGC